MRHFRLVHRSGIQTQKLNVEFKDQQVEEVAVSDLEVAVVEVSDLVVVELGQVVVELDLEVAA